MSGARQMLSSGSDFARVYIQNLRRGVVKDHWSSKNDARVRCVRVLQDVMVRPRPRLGLSGPTCFLVPTVFPREVLFPVSDEIVDDSLGFQPTVCNLCTNCTAATEELDNI